MAEKKSQLAGKTDPRMDLYIAKAAPFAKPILEHVRELMHGAWPEVVETMKWQHPFFTHENGKIIASIGAFKEHCRLGIWHAEAAAAIREAAGHDADARGSVVKVRSLHDLPPRRVLQASLKKAAEAAADRRTKLPRKEYQTPKAPLEVPADLAAALKKNKAAGKTFDGFTAPSARREYVEWITGAKQEETRKRRIAQAIEMLAEGKTRNWKYETR
jgi:uncharacterized protein YdeI (YjbR/CyaY-like superfamily)